MGNLAKRIVFLGLVWIAAATLLVLVLRKDHRSLGPRISGVRPAMRSLAIAIEAYYVDNNAYPLSGIGNTGPGGTQTYNYWIVKSTGRSGDPMNLPGFLMNKKTPGGKFQTLTTPMAYITAYPADTFSPFKGATFVYWSVQRGQPDPAGRIVGKDTPFGGVGWILISPGLDGDYDIPMDSDVYDPSIPQPSARLLAGTNKKGSAFTYDPTNGTISNGDIWRIRQPP